MSISSLETRRHLRHNESNEISPFIADRRSSEDRELSFKYFCSILLSLQLTAVVYIVGPLVVHVRIVLQLVQFFRDAGRVLVVDLDRVFSPPSVHRRRVIVMIRLGKIFESVVQSPVGGIES